ncbi:MAG: YitT family protein [Negativicutes bacterium]|nr:YitT family protein [Negativicutes bacterium]
MTDKKRSGLRIVRDYIFILVGCLVTAIGLNIFLIPNKIPDGGFTSLAMVLHYLLNVPVGMTLLVLNLPVLLLGLKVLGRRFSLNTMFGAVALAVSIDATVKFVPVITHNPLLAALYGGVLCGIGMGTVFRFRGSTAGTDLAAAIVNRLTGIKVGSSLMMVDFVIILLAGIVFGNMELCLFGLITVFTTAYLVDFIQEGWESAKMFMIISNRPQAVAEHVMEELERGVTFLHGQGGYTGESKDVLFCVVSKREVTKLRDAIRDIDERAFVIVADAREVMGEGFTPHHR